jgi:hypothetical protein
MAINWDEIRKKANERGKSAERQVKAIQRPATLPRATEPTPPRRTLPTPQLTRNATGQTSITPERQAKNTQTFLNELKGKQGIVASAAAGVGAGLTGGGRQYMAPETRQEIESKPALNRAFTGGQIAGSIPGFAAPYAAAAKPITAAVSKLPAIAKMSPIAQKIAGSVATDLAVGLPLNVNYALNAEGLRGKDAVKSIAVNTGIDLVTGGILEAVPVLLKSGKRVASKADFDTLPPIEQAEVKSELERLAYESNVRKGKITPQGATLYGNAPQPIAGELPAPANQIQPELTKVYHGTKSDINDIGELIPGRRLTENGKTLPRAEGTIGNKSTGTNKIYVTDNPQVAMSYGKVLEGYLPGKVLDVRSITNDFDEIRPEYAELFSDYMTSPYFNEYPMGRNVFRNSYLQGRVENFIVDGSPEINEYLKSKGFSAVSIPYIDDVQGPSHEIILLGGNSLKSKQQLAYDAAKGQREVPRTITPNELSGATKTQPQTLPRAIDLPVQPRIPESGITEQAFAKNGDLPKFKDLGADTFKGNKSIDDLVNEFGAIPKGEQPRAREIDIPRKTDSGEVQQYARTLQESAIVDDTLFNDINEAVLEGSLTKSRKANRVAVDDANSTLESGIDEAMMKFRSVLAADKQATSYDIALGNRVLQELQNQGRYSDAVDVAIDLSQILSETGRTLQAARIAKRLSPEGRLMMVTRTADKVSRKTRTKVKLSDETVRLIGEAKTEKEIVEANQKAAEEIWNQVPANWIDKINSWRYMAMLFNPKTHARNIIGNTIFVPVREFKNLLGAGLERVLIRNGERTKAVLNPVKDKEIIKFADNDFDNVKLILKNEGKIDDNIRPLDAKVFNTRILEGIRKFNLGALDAEDTWFMRAAYDSSLAQYMKANKLTPDKMVGASLESARKYAMDEALKATYRDFNSLANLISRGKAAAASGKYGPLGRVGGVVLEGAIPFSKTPLNIIKRGLGYSPANLVRGIVNLGRVKSGKVTATEAIDQLASGLSGTALMGLGTWLGYNNIVNGKEGDFKDKLYNYNQMLGSQNYSLNIDGKSYTLDWAAPLSMPFFVGVELSKAVKDNNADLASVLDAMTQISDPMINLSMLKGINDIVKTNMSEGSEGVGKIGLNVTTGYLGQYVPTLGGQIARTVDDTRRSTISTAGTMLEREVDKFGKKQLAKLPMASKQLEPYIDLWGREQKNGTAIENFLSPGYFKQENITPVDRELLSLIGKLDKETAQKIVPASTAYEYDLTSNSVSYRMTEKESTAYQKTRGQESYKGLNKLFSSVDYRRMNNEEKAKAIQDVYTAAGQKAKYEYFDNKGLPVTLALSTEYQAKYDNIKNFVSDKQFYAAVQSIKGKSKDIEKAYAIEARLPKASDKLYSSLGISAETVSRARDLKQNRITAAQYQTALTVANTNGNANVSKAEAMAYLDSTNLDVQQKYVLMKALVPSLKDKNNPYW